MAFTRQERGLIAMAASIVFTRVFAFSLTTLGFTEYARSLLPAGTPAHTANLLAGLALGAYGVTMALAQLASGILSDRIGRKPVLAGGTALFILGALICVAASDVRLLVLGRLVAGLGGVSSVAMAAVGETVPSGRRTTAMALVGIPAGLGVFLGFALGPVLAARFGFASLFWLTAALGAVAAVGLLRPLPSRQPGLAHVGRLSRSVVALALAGFCINFAMNTVMFDFQTGVLSRIGEAGLAGTLLAAFVVMGGASRAIDRRHVGLPRLALAALLGLLALAAPLFRTASGLPLALVAGGAFFAAHATLSAVLPSQVSRLSGRLGGTGHGIQLVVAYLGSAAGAFAAGWSAPRLTGAFFLLAAACGLAVALLWERRAEAGAPRGEPA